MPYSPGGGYYNFARLIATYLQKPLGVARVDVVADPGGGGLVGANDLAAAKPDGLTIGEPNGAGVVFDTIFHIKGVNFNVKTLNWLGRPDDEVMVVVLGPGGPSAPKGGFKSFAQLMAVGKQGKKIFALTPGKGDSEYFGLAGMLTAFGVPARIITAYSGSHTTEAGLLRGDGSVTMFGYGSLRTLITSSKVKPIAIETNHSWSVLPKVPTLVQLGQKYHLNAQTMTNIKALDGVMRMGHTFAAPPGVPAARLAFLRKAFKAATTNPKFVAEANKEHRYPKFAPGSVLKSEADNALAAAAGIRALVNGKG